MVLPGCSVGTGRCLMTGPVSRGSYLLMTQSGQVCIAAVIVEITRNLIAG